MTDQIDQITDDVDDVPTEVATPNRRRMFIAGAGLAGAAALVGSKSVSAADGASYTGTTTTFVNNTAGGATPGAVGGEAIVGDNTNPANGSHTIRGNTNGIGHGIAGTVPANNANNAVAATWGKHDNGKGAGVGGVNGATNVGIAGPARGVEGLILDATNGSHAVFGGTPGDGHAVAGASSKRDNARATTWGKHEGLGAGIGGENNAADVPIAGPARGVEGIILNPTNGSHAVFGLTPGDGHAIAGSSTKRDNARATTWGKHEGLGAGVGGENNAADVPIAGPAHGVEGIVLKADNGSHAVFGTTAGGGHSVAGDTPANAAGPGGVGPNTTAATWGRHNGIGAGIGGISINGYGGEFIGGKASARLIPSMGVPTGAPSNDGHLRGELFVDGAGVLWYNTADGNNWIPLSQGGNVLWVNPARAYDSRASKPTPANSNKTKFAAGEIRSIDLSEFTDFPKTATAALINLTVVNAEGRGFATLFNGATADADRPDTSNINWDTNTGTDVVANSATVRADVNGVIKVYTSMPTNVVIDIQGYIA